MSQSEGQGEWLLESYRISVFFPEQRELPGPGWWKIVTGEEPSLVNTPKGLRQESGAAFGGQVQLGSNGIRVDWVLTGADPAAGDILPFKLFSNPEKSVADFVGGLKKWFESCPPVNRVAVAASHVGFVNDQPAALELLKAKLFDTVKIDPQHQRELQYAVNRPKASSVRQDILINRVGRWGMATYRKFMLSLAEGQVGAERDIMAARADFDVNTIPLAETIPPDVLLSLVDELVSLEKELQKNGDRL